MKYLSVYMSTFFKAAAFPQQVPSFKSTYITAELALLFSQSDSEEEFEGFREEEDQGLGSRLPKATVGSPPAFPPGSFFSEASLRLCDTCSQRRRRRTLTWTMASTLMARRRRGHRRRGGAS